MKNGKSKVFHFPFPSQLVTFLNQEILDNIVTHISTRTQTV